MLCSLVTTPTRARGPNACVASYDRAKRLRLRTMDVQAHGVVWLTAPKDDHSSSNADRLSAPRASDAAVTSCAVVGGGRVPRQILCEPKDCAITAETGPTASACAKDLMFGFEHGHECQDAVDRNPRLTRDARDAESVCPNAVHDCLAIRRLVTRVGHGLALVLKTSARSGAPCKDVAYARS